MDYKRIIPCLDVQDGRLVKGVHFENMQDVGDPVETAEYYSKAGADELVMLDIAATIENKHIIVDIVKKTVERISIPLTVGGGIKTLEDIQALIDVNVTRVCIGTAAVHNPDLLKNASAQFGKDRIIAAVDTYNSFDTDSGFEVVVRSGTEPTKIDAVEWAKQVESFGVSGILQTSVDAEGTQEGYDVPAIQAIADAVNIPVFASGGAGKLEDLAEAIVEGHADAVLVASLIHFNKYTIQQMKEFLSAQGIPVNL